MKYELNEIYVACAKTPIGSYKVYFTSSESRITLNTHCVSIRTDPRYHYEHIHFVPDTTICYSSPDGDWFMTAREGQYPTWVFKRGGHTYEPEVLEVGMQGKHYDTIVIDDMVDAFGYAVTANKDVEKEVKQVTEWYEKAKKEVKGKMYLQIFDVILFNRKTKQIDFREDMIAENPDEVYLLAVQKFGKYDPKVHVKQANCILGFTEFKED